MIRPYLFFLARLDAFSGLTLACADDAADLTWVAMLQLPTFQRMAGSGLALQYQPELNSMVRPQPLQFSTISWHTPPLYAHPLAVINGHSLPALTVLQIIGSTSQEFSVPSVMKKGLGGEIPAFFRQLFINLE